MRFIPTAAATQFRKGSQERLLLRNLDIAAACGGKDGCVLRYDIAIVGGGPAGLSAAVQARQRGKTAAVISGGSADSSLWKAHRVDNYLGLPQCSGAELLRHFEAHAQAMGAERLTGRVLSIMPMEGVFYLSVGSDVVEAGAVVLAPGVARAAKFPGEEALLGRGVSYCATCDGMFYRGKEVIVVGKAEQAPEEAAYLQGIGCHVTYVSDTRPAQLPDDMVFVPAKRIEIQGEGQVTGVRLDGETQRCDGVFILRAAMAPTDLLPELKLNGGFIAVDRDMATNLPGVFAAGDCTGQPLQVSKAVGEGMLAGHLAAEYLDHMESK